MTEPAGGRRDDILGVATELFRTRGYHGTRVDDIADEVGLNKATVYHYYDSKASILFAIYLRASHQIAELLEEVGELDDPIEQVRRYIRNAFELIVVNSAQVAVYFQEAPFIEHWLSPEQVAEIRRGEADFEGNLRRIFEVGAKDGLFESYDATMVTLSFIGMTSWFFRWYNPQGRYSIEDVALEFSRIFLGGLLRDRSLVPAAKRPGRRKARPAN